MMEGRGRILISRSFRKKDLQKSTVEKILNHLSSISKKYGGEAADKRAEELIVIIEKANTEADILSSLEKMER
jgi:hypothetical protein